MPSHGNQNPPLFSVSLVLGPREEGHSTLLSLLARVLGPREERRSAFLSLLAEVLGPSTRNSSVSLQCSRRGRKGTPLFSGFSDRGQKGTPLFSVSLPNRTEGRILHSSQSPCQGSRTRGGKALAFSGLLEVLGPEGGPESSKLSVWPRFSDRGRKGTASSRVSLPRFSDRGQLGPGEERRSAVSMPGSRRCTMRMRQANTPDLSAMAMPTPLS